MVSSRPPRNTNFLMAPAVPGILGSMWRKAESGRRPAFVQNLPYSRRLAKLCVEFQRHLIQGISPKVVRERTSLSFFLSR